MEARLSWNIKRLVKLLGQLMHKSFRSLCYLYEQIQLQESHYSYRISYKILYGLKTYFYLGKKFMCFGIFPGPFKYD